MQAIRCVIVFIILLLSIKAANAQGACNYRFLEVLDTAGKPVADAKAEPLGAGATQQTDANGAVKQLEVCYGDNTTEGLRVSKPGYYTYEDARLFDRFRCPKLLYGEIPGYDPHGPIKISLLKIPTDEAERKAAEAEQRRRELIQAIKKGDLASVEKLLRAGASADTTDAYGIPAILWAAIYGDSKMIRALIAARADVRNKGRPGRKVLLYYLSCNMAYLYRADKDPIDYELVELLIKAGADVNAADWEAVTVLSVARQSGSAKLVKLLESAGAR